MGDLVRLRRVPAKIVFPDATKLYSKYTLLTEEENLSIIKLRVNDIYIIKNSTFIRINNFIRSKLRWLLD